MGLPKQIQKQIKERKEIEEALTQEQEKLKGPDTTQSEIDDLLNEVDPKVELEEKPKASVTELKPAEGGDPAPEPEPELKIESKPERTDWKQKYNVLQGKYDAEVPRLSQDLRTAMGRITTLETTAATAPAPPPLPEPVAQPTFTAEEIDEYGEDLLNVVGRKAQEIAKKEFEPLVSNLQTQLNNLNEQVGVTGQKVAKQEQNEVYALLDREVQDWRQINTDPNFIEWVGQVDPFSGFTRQKLMIDAFDSKDALRVKAFFEGFLMENAAVTPAPTPAPAAQAGNTGTLELGDYIAPGTPKGGGQAGAPKEKRIWSGKDVGKFYSDVQKGHYKKRPEDKIRIEADIIAATREGRVQN